MSGYGKKLRLRTAAVSLGCSCRKPKLSDIFHPKPKSKTPTIHKHPHLYNSSSSNPWYRAIHCSFDDEEDGDTATTTTTTTATVTTEFSPNVDSSSDPETALFKNFGFMEISGGGTVAVEKNSDDPYKDFRQSMLQMILEKDIYSKEELKQLLNCFLELNSEQHHGVIIRAFTEIWNGVFCFRSSRGGGGGAGGAAITAGKQRGRRSRDFHLPHVQQ